ncbi:hypothetical protein MKW94_015728 [Papaver nudicaule]|uniref:TF-B3 domain-containing protein n=1 Tax=Papaver nudicaule TaxID=74823 RepID=A0AA41VPJ1_PAPNU|nr:hypothetical protein [Papaver nudicaule]
MFDNGNFCEIESSYFVKNCQGCHRSNGGLNERRRVESEPSIEITEPKRQRYRENSIPISDDDEEEIGDSEAPPRLLGRVPICNRRRSTRLVRGCKSKAIVRRTEVSVTDDNTKDSEAEINQVKPLAIVLERRSVARKETHLAYQQAVCEGKRRGRPHFVVRIQPSHVSGNFFMIIPAKSVKEYLPCEHQDVSLKVKDKTWQVRFFYYGEGRTSGFSRLGWQDFVRENNVEVGNACLFEASSSSLTSKTSRNQLTFNVSIFRKMV